jgi:hypothetical protein
MLAIGIIYQHLVTAGFNAAIDAEIATLQQIGMLLRYSFRLKSC